MFRTLLNLTASCVLLLSSIAHAGIVIESTRYLYKEGAREITAQIENKDDIPYLIKSWVETPAGKAPSFMATPPLFRLEGKGNDSNLLIVFYVQIVPDDFVMQLHRF